MTQARSDITLKFNELPQVKPAENKKVEIILTDQNGVHVYRFAECQELARSRKLMRQVLVTGVER
ncbi:MAG: hypothetical protein N4J56_006852 [Chroococcidiopsis sp. SAG 2025]|uniref:hypothetical protein n=1 Tax=Chroococcidiopsis sp. SAG 2025 TaxID=171389 RepID=UPI00293729B1|nr:hypothetical protein [Chroococcidiopsis sp. SAG 2025]MDV2997147.1 hypothetical protein [Chroococcidiopsis sp. SAG 2025]